MRLRSPKLGLLPGCIIINVVNLNNSQICQSLIQNNDMEPFENDSVVCSPVQLVIDTGLQKLILVIYPDSEAFQLARCFCYENNLDYKLIPTIASKVKQIMQETFGLDEEEEQVPIFNRAHQSTKSYQVQYNNNHTKDSKISHHNSYSLNRGELLYQRNMRLEEKKRRHLQSIEEQIKNRENKHLTFEPKINKLSHIIAQKLQQSNISLNQRNYQKRINKSLTYKEERQKQTMENCTFKPKINKSSQKNSDSNRYNSLYEDMYRRNHKLQKMTQLKTKELNFKPDINRISQVLVGQISFQERLTRDNQRREFKKNKKQDQELSKSRHRPQTGRPPMLRNIQNLPIGQYLYNRNKKAPSLTPVQKPSFVDCKSQKLYQIKKLNIFQSIFYQLDLDFRGQIVWSQVQNNIVDPDVWDLIYPVIEEMIEMKVSLNKEQFVNSLQQLWRSLSLLQRNRLFKLFRLYSEKENDLSKSVINHNKSSSSNINLGVKKSKISVQKQPKIRAFR